MRFTTAIIALQEQPPVEGLGKLLGVVASSLQRVGLPGAKANLPAWLKGFKGQGPQFFQVAECVEPLTDPLADLVPPAAADLDFAKGGMSDWQIRSEIASACTMRAVGIAQLGRQFRDLNVRQTRRTLR